MPRGIFKRIVGKNCGLSTQGFQKGYIPWSKGTKGLKKATSGSFKKGHIGYKSMLGKHHTLETRKKLSDSLKGRKSPKGMLGKHLSEEARKKISEKIKKNLPQTEETKKKMSVSNHRIWKGKHLPKEIRRKMSEAQKGEKSYLWKGGITPINMKIRSSLEYKNWEYKILDKYNWKCQKCNEVKKFKLTVHHIKNFAKYHKLRFSINNGFIFCKICHREFHKKYGIKNNNFNQIKEFIWTNKI